jgi:Spx/MgsR family transcriptional regulator
MIKVFGVPSCNKIRNTKNVLDNNAIAYEFVNVKKTPVSSAQLKIIVEQLGIDKVLNKQGLTYKKLGLKEKNLSENELFDWLLKEQGMIKRPLIEKEGRYAIESDKDKIIEFCTNKN